MAEWTVEFVGVESGDHECFCWNVDADTFRRLTGDDPTPDDAARFGPKGLYRLYPDDLMPAGSRGRHLRVRVTVEVMGPPVT